MAITPSGPRRPSQSAASRHSLYAQAMQISVIMAVIIAVVALTFVGKMSGDVAAGILGAIVGHAGSAVIRASGVRSGDPHDRPGS